MLDSTWEMRRKAPFHFHAKAVNARMAAFVISNIPEEIANSMVSDVSYNGTISLALHESFLREASIAMELILKAIICVKTKKPPKRTHDVYKLWKEAKLPSVDPEDNQRLLMMTETLYWSGRYAAPINDKQYEKLSDLMDHYSKKKKLGDLTFTSPTSLGWAEFDRLFFNGRKLLLGFRPKLS